MNMNSTSQMEGPQKQHWGLYLNDHLAGSVAAIEMIEHLIESYPAERDFLVALRDDIRADQTVLKRLIDRIEFRESAPRKALAWLAEKAGEWKLSLDDKNGGEFRWFEALELLSLGIEGKRLLWGTFAVAAEHIHLLQGIDYPQLIQRAQQQRKDVDAHRHTAIFDALVGRRGQR
jgi:hypothetical protein